MSLLEMQVDALMRLCTAEKESDREKAKEDVRRMLECCKVSSACADPEYLIRNLLLEMGTPEHLVGHPYTVQAVLLVIQDRTCIHSLTFGLYPQLAVMFDTTASRVERAIRHMIEVTWTRGDLEVLSRYFGNTVCAAKCKPTNGEFIARLANIVMQKLREAA